MKTDRISNRNHLLLIALFCLIFSERALGVEYPISNDELSNTEEYNFLEVLSQSKFVNAKWFEEKDQQDLNYVFEKSTILSKITTWIGIKNKKSHKSAHHENKVLVSPKTRLAPSAMMASTGLITLYENDFENPSENPPQQLCGLDLSQRPITFLYGNEWEQVNTVETILINGPGNIYTDPNGTGGNYAIMMLTSLQNDQAGLTVNTQNKNFLNIQLDISPSRAQACGNFLTYTDMQLKVTLYDAPGGNINLGSILGDTTLVGPTGGNTDPFTFNWTTHTFGMDASGSTDGNVSFRFDALSPNEWNAFDNIKVTASDVQGQVDPDPGAAFDFDDSNSFVTGINGSFQDLNNFTFEAWLNPTPNAGSLKRFYNSSSFGFFTGRVSSSNTELEFQFMLEQANLTTLSYTTTVFGWHHIAVTGDGTTWKMYIDGQLVDSAPQTNNTHFNTADRLGGTPTTEYVGGMDEVRMWTTARTCQEINAFMNCELTGTESNLYNYFKFNQGLAGMDNTSITTLVNEVAGGASPSITSFDRLSNTGNFIAPGGVTTGNSCGSLTFPDMAVEGMSVNIPNGDTSPETADDTDFASVNVNDTHDHTFTIKNTGSAVLNLTGTHNLVTISGDTEFTIQTQPASNTVAATNGMETFVVRYAPTAIGTHTATVSIANSDCDDDPFTFDVSGVSIESPADVDASGFSLWLDADDIDGDGMSRTVDNDLDEPANGGDIAVWHDKSGNDADATVQSSIDNGDPGAMAPSMSTNQFNGQPVVEFSESNQEKMQGEYGNTHTGDWTLFLVFRTTDPTPPGNSAVFTGGHNSGFNNNLPNRRWQIQYKDDVDAYRIAGGTGPQFEGFHTGWVTYSVRRTTGTSIELFSDGQLITSPADDDAFNGFSHYRLNYGYVSTGIGGDKQIAEIIAYQRALDDCEMNKINEYLSNKYGAAFVSVDDEYEYDVTHPNEIAGIGIVPPLGGACSSPTTINSLTTSILMISNPSSNDTNGEYLTVGDDNGALTSSTEVPAGYGQRLTREWRADEDGNLGTVDICFDTSGLAGIGMTLVDFALLIDSDGNFSNATVHTTGANFSDSKICFTGVDLNNGDYFTLATNIAPGAALDFDGVNDVVEITDPHNWAAANTSFTIELWINSSDADNTFRNGFFTNYGGTNQIPYFMLGFNDTDVFFDMRSTTSDEISSTAPENTVMDGNWHHIAGVRDASTSMQYFYIDGELVDSDPAVMGDIRFQSTLSVMDHFDRYVDGQIDEIRVWSEARSCEEIKQYKDCELTGTETNLESYYQFNQGIAGGVNSGETTLEDKTANNRDGTLTGFTLSGTASNWITPGGVTTGVNCPVSITFPEMSVEGNSTEIMNGDDTPSTDDDTDFGAVIPNTMVDHTFTIKNTGSAVLNLTGSHFIVTVSGDAAFTIETQPGASTVAATHGVETFVVRYNPTSNGNHTATVSIESDDCDEDPYTFDVTGEAQDPEPGIDFDGTDDYILADVDFSSLTQLTVEMWINRDALASNIGIFQWANQVSDPNPFLLIQENASKIRGYVNGSYSLNSTSDVPIGVWTHIAVTHDGTAWNLYVNGSLESSNISGLAAAANGLYIGNGFSGYFDGQIDEVRVWGKARSQAEIQGNMNCDVPQQQNLLAYYRFNDGTANGNNTGMSNTFDYSGNGNCGIFHNLDLSSSASNYVDGAIHTCNAISVVFPEISVEGNTTEIMDGDDTPSTADDTDFGAVIPNTMEDHTFTIKNTGTAVLNLTGSHNIVTISGDAEFMIQTQPGSSTVAATNGMETFVVRYRPVSAGSHSATVSIESDDCDEDPYTFDIKGNAALSCPTNTSCPANYTSVSGPLIDLELSNSWDPANGVINASTSGSMSGFILNSTPPVDMTVSVSGGGGVNTNRTGCKDNAEISGDLTLSFTATCTGEPIYLKGISITMEDFEANELLNIVSYVTTDGSITYGGGIWGCLEDLNGLALVETGNMLEIHSSGSFTTTYANASGYQPDKIVTLPVQDIPISSIRTSLGFGFTIGSAIDGACIPNAAIDAEISVEGQNMEIVDGDNTPSLDDDTDFGCQILMTNTDHTFTISNDGTGTLNLTGTPRVDISGNTAFSIETQPSANNIPTGSSDLTFVVRYRPTTAGDHTATISIQNNDCDENPYTFDVTGTGGVLNSTSMHFDGDDDYINIEDSDFYTSDFTIEGWFKSLETNNHDYAILNGQVPGTGNSGLYLGIGTANQFRFFYRNPPANGGGIEIQSSTNVSDAQWHHFACVFDTDDRLRLYIDGVLEGTSGTVTPLGSNVMLDLLLGFNVPSNRRHFDGNMDEIRVWNDARTQAEIQEYMFKELTGSEANLDGYFKFDDNNCNATDCTSSSTFGERIGPNGDNNLPQYSNDTPNVLDATCAGGGGTPNINVKGGGEVITNNDNTPSTDDNTDFGSVVSGGSDTHTFTIENTGVGGLTIDANAITVNTTTANVFALGTVSETLPHTLAQNESLTFQVIFSPSVGGSSFTGSVEIISEDCNNSPFTFDLSGSVGDLAGALDFDGVDDKVLIPHNLAYKFNDQDFSVEVWVKFNGALTEVARLLDTRKGNGPGYTIQVNETNRVTFIAEGISNRFSDAISDAVPMSDGNWHHIAGTYRASDGEANLYIDGVLRNTRDGADNLNTSHNNTQDMSLGARLDNTDFDFNGQMDEVRIWGDVRTANEICQNKDCELMGNEAGLVAYYNFNQGVVNGNNTGITTLPNEGPAPGSGTLNGTLQTGPGFALTGTSSNWVAATNGVSGACGTIPEILVLGGSTPTEIMDGDDSPSATDSTDLGKFPINSSQTVTYIIRNSGNATLNLTDNPNVSISGDPEFSVHTQPTSSSIPSGGSDLTFTIQYSPTSANTHDATISIANNDCDENPYTFDIRGSGVIPGAALDFDGNNDGVDLPESNLLPYGVGQSFTIEMMVKTGITSQGDVQLYSFQKCHGLGTIQINLLDDGTPRFRLANPGTNVYAHASNHQIDDNMWHHIVGIRDVANNETRIYVDGELAGTGVDNLMSGFVSGEETEWLGRRDDCGGTDEYQGQMDEVRIWSDVRSCEEINHFKDCELMGDEANLVSYYQFNQGIAGGNNSEETTLEDQTSNNLHGTLTDFGLNGNSSNWITPGAVTSGNTCSGTVTSPEMMVEGNSMEIVSGDITPSMDDHTDFGTIIPFSVVDRTFTIKNTGTGTLDLTGNPIVRIQGSTDFSVLTQPSANSIASGAADLTFTLRYAPTTVSSINLQLIEIANNDCDEAPYVFYVKGAAIGAEEALNFDGDNDHVIISPPDVINNIPALTFETWVYLDQIRDQVIYRRQGLNNQDMAIDLKADGSIQCFMDGSNFGQTPASVLNINQWYHIAMVFDGNGAGNSDRMKIYVNGNEQTLSFTGTMPSTSPNAELEEAFLGSLRGTSMFLDGTLDEFRIWKTARTQAEILNNMTCDVPQDDDLVGYYRFNEGTANGDNSGITNVLDYSGNCTFGTLHNFTKTGTFSNYVMGIVGTCNVLPNTEAEISVEGMGEVIMDGDDEPSTDDDTNFGTHLVNTTHDHSFTIKNTGPLALDLEAAALDRVTISGTGASHFNVKTQPNSASVAATNGMVTFEIQYAPTATGDHEATVSIANSDCDENPYNFDISGSSINCSIAITDVTKTDEVCPGANDGTISVMATCASCNSSSDIRYSLDNSDFSNTTGQFTGLEDDTYTVYVRDVNNTACNTSQGSVVIEAGSDITPVLTVSDTEICEGDNGTTNMIFTVTLQNDLCESKNIGVEIVDVTAEGGSDYEDGLIDISTDQLTFGGFDAHRAASTALITGGSMAQLRDVLNLNLNNPILTETRTLTDQYLATIDVLIISSWDRAILLTQDEQDAMLNFVLNGGALLSFQENGHWSGINSQNSNESFVDIFGMDMTPSQNCGNATVTITNTSHPVTNGPFGMITSFPLVCTGWYTNMGPHAECLGTHTHGCGLAVIDPGVISPGSGGVILIPDGNGATSAGLESITTLLLNGIQNSLNVGANGITFAGNANEEQTVTVEIFGDESVETDETFTLNLKYDGQTLASATGTIENDDCMITGSSSIAANAQDLVYSAPAGMSSYSWEVESGNAVIDGIADMQNVTIDAMCEDFTLKVSVEDPNGCTYSCEIDVTVNDTGIPSIDCTDDISVNNEPGECGANITVPMPTISDNCGTPTLVNDFNNTSNANGIYPVGETIVTWTATDAAGNSNTCSQTVTVSDTEIPSISCADDVSVNNDPGECNAFVTVISPTATDNCVSPSNNALHFDGQNDRVTVSNSYAFGSTDFSIEFWLIIDELKTGEQYIITKDQSGTYPYFRFVVKPDGRVSMDLAQSAGYGTGVASTTVLSPEQWYHIAFVRSGSDKLMYVNGILENTTTSTIVNVNNIYDIILGTRTSGDRPLDGSLDDVRIWSDARTAQEIVDNKDTELIGSEDNLELYYDFDNGTPCTDNNGITMMSDLSPNGRDGTLTSFALSEAMCCNSNWAPGVPVLGGSFTVINDYNNTCNASDTYPIGETTVTWTVTDASGNTNTCTQKVTVLGAEISVEGQNMEIDDGDDTPMPGDDTDFGLIDIASDDTHTFTIKNGGTATLNVTSITVSPNTDFSITAGASGGTVTTTGSDLTFEVTFDPSTVGAKTATVSIANDDCDEDPYTFDVTGTAYPAGILINEVDVEDTGDDDMEFIELFDGGVGNTSLDGLVLVLFNGSDDASYDALDLDGESTDVNGYFVIGNSGVTNVDATIPDGSLQNGADAIALIVGDDTDYPDDTPVTMAENIIDAIVYDTDDADDNVLISNLLNSGQPQVNENANSMSGTQSMQRIANGSGGLRNTSSYQMSFPTPGAVNSLDNIPPTVLSFERQTPDAEHTNADILVFRVTFDEDVRNVDDSDFDVDGSTASVSNVAMVSGSDSTYDVTVSGGNLASLNGAVEINLNSGQNIEDLNGNDLPNSEPATDEKYLLDNIATPTCSDTTIYLGANGMFSIDSSFVSQGTKDTSGIATIEFSQGDFDCSHIGDELVTVTLTDTLGNEGMCNVTVTVMDTISPTAICKDTTLYLDPDGLATLTPSHIDNGSNDVCSAVQLGVSNTSFGCNTADYALALDGNNDHVVMPNDIVAGLGDFTFETWINYVDNGIWSRVFDIGSSPMVNMFLTPKADGGGNNGTPRLAITVNGNNAEERIDAHDPMPTGWHHIAVTLDKNENTGVVTGVMYIDGNVVGTNTNMMLTPADLGVTTQNFLGRSQYVADPYLRQYLDETRIWSIAKTQAQIQADMNRALSGNELGLFLYYNYEDGPGSTTIADLSTSMNDGTLSNADAANAYISPGVISVLGVGTHEVTLTVTDASGNISTCTSMVTVMDTISPMAVCQDTTIYLDSDGRFTLTTQHIDDNSKDNCTIANMTLSKSNLTCDDVGSQSIMLTVNDVNGNDDVCSATVTVLDTISPMAMCQDTTVYLGSDGMFTIDSSFVNDGSTDNCGIESMTLSKSVFSCDDVGSESIMLTVNDLSGNDDVCSATVTVMDTISPMAMCQDTTVYLGADGMFTIDSSFINLNSSDNCSIETITLSKTTFVCNDIGGMNNHALDFDGTDESVDFGNVAAANFGTGEFTIEFWVRTDQSEDDEVALISKRAICNNDNFWNIRMNMDGTIRYEHSDGISQFATIHSNSVVNDNVWHHVAVTRNGILITIYIDGTLDISNSGANPNLNNSASLQIGRDACSGLFGYYLDGQMDEVRIWSEARSATEINDNKDIPLSGSESNLIAYYDFEDGSGSSSLSDRSSNNNHGTLINMDPSSDWIVKDVPTEVILTVTDVNGNSDICSAMITVMDTISPMAMCQDTTVYLGEDGMFTIDSSFVNDGSTDNCGIESMTLSKFTFDCNNFVNPIVLGNGLEFDGIDDQLLCGNDNSLQITGTSLTLEAWIYPTVFENNTFEANIINKEENRPDNGYMLRVGDNGVLEFQFGDGSWISLQSPDNSLELNKWQHVAATYNGAQMKLFVNGVEVASKNETAIIANSDVPLVLGSSHNFPDRVFTGIIDEVRIWNIVRTENDLQTNYQKELNGSESGLVAYYQLNDGAGSTTTHDATGNGNIGTLTYMDENTDWVGGAQIDEVLQPMNLVNVTLTVTDTNGNSDVCSATVTVMDTISPMAMCQDTTVYLGSDGMFTIDSSYVNDSSTDNCSIESMTLSKSVFTCDDVGSESIMLTVNDVNGNDDVCSATITVMDTISPMAMCQDTMIYLDAAGMFTIDSSYVNDSSTDNCGIASMSISKSVFTCDDVGSESIMLMVNDVNGNSNVCSATITVIDSIAAIIMCPDEVTISHDDFIADMATMTMVGRATAVDNCGGDVTITFSDTEECLWGLRRRITRTWRAEDEQGNVTTCDQIINVTADPELLILGDFVDGTTFLCNGSSFTFEANYLCNSDGYEWDYSGTSPLTVINDTTATLNVTTDVFGGGDHTLTLKAYNGNDTVTAELTIIITDPFFCEFLTECSADFINMNAGDMAADLLPNKVHAVIGVRSDGKVDEGDKYEFKAGEFIELNPGFEVSHNALFLANIEDCNASLISLEEKISNFKNLKERESKQKYLNRILSRN